MPFCLCISPACAYNTTPLWCLRVFPTVVRTAWWEVPWNIRRMSSANVTISTFDALDSVSINPLIMIFHRVGPDTDPCGHPLVIRLELSVSPSLMWAFRFSRKSFMVM